MQCVFSSLFRPMTKLMWIPACNETNLPRASKRQLCWSMASSWRRLSRHPVDQPSVSMIVQWALMWVYRISHCPTFSVNSLWIIGVCYRGMLVSVGQSHDISLWSILSLGNRSINVEMIYKLRVFDINWYLITLIIYVQTLKWLLGELTRGYDTPV